MSEAARAAAANKADWMSSLINNALPCRVSCVAAVRSDVSVRIRTYSASDGHSTGWCWQRDGFKIDEKHLHCLLWGAFLPPFYL